MFQHFIEAFTGKTKNMKKTFLSFIILFIGITYSCVSTNIKPEITKSELSNHIKFLASDSLKGRYPGTPEDKVAAQYIASEFEKTGLELIPENGLQGFPVQIGLKLGDSNSLTIENTQYEVNKDFIPLAYSSSNFVESKVAFAGYGFNIETNESSWNDYEDINVKDKWVIVLRGEPNLNNVKLPFGMYSSLRSKATTAKDLGAAGVIFVSGVEFDKDDELIKLGRPEGKIDIPIIQIKRDIVDNILLKTNKSIQALESEIKAKESPNSFEIDYKIKCKTDISIDTKETYNVAGKLIINPDFKNFIVIGAHYDHLGFGGIGSGSRAPNENMPHYGADDNASGVSAIIEIAEKLISKKDSLKSNFLFVAFGAEEMGLLGSKYFTNNLPIEKISIKTMINIDMIGRMKPDNGLQVNGVGTSLEGENILTNLNKTYNLKLGFSYEGYGPSDHSSFYSKDIPVFFFSTGAHIDYHTPGDSLGKINLNGLKLASNYIFDFAYKLSSENILLTFQEAGPKTPDSPGRKNFKVTLGIMPDFSNVEKRGLRADIVIKDKAAYKAGMKDGDIIVAIDGFEVSDVYEYMERLTKLKAGQIITVEVIREDKKEVLIVQL